MPKKKRIPIGIEFYKEIIDENYYYADKTWIIKELFDKGGKVNLFIRPRRFGKTLLQTMLRTFFEAEIDASGHVKDNSRYFDGMKIMDAGDEYTRHLGQYPVIFFSLKSAKQPTFEMAYQSLTDDVLKEFKRHRYVLLGETLDSESKERYQKLMNRRAGEADYAKSIAFLSECLEQYHGKKTIILIDEYDVPLDNSYFEGFYEQMVTFIRSLFESVLKTNESLEFAVITGCLRISKESIFTGLNNLEVISILNKQYAESFGFTQAEAEQMLGYYELTQKKQELKDWYDGYLFGNAEVYNPWSVINYVKTAVIDEDAFPKPYWSNTSSNSIIKELVEIADSVVKDEIEELIAGGTIEKQIHEDITYGDIHQSQENLWNFLFFTGYLKAVSQRFEEDTIYLTMRIPNAEIRYIYRNTIREWFERGIGQCDFTKMYQALLSGDGDVFEEAVRHQLSGSISYFDSEEDFYHEFLLGLLRPLQNYKILSNRESGNGRPDIVLKPYDERKAAVVLELKHVKKYTEMDAECDQALRQIEEQQYEKGILEEGYGSVISYGICFCKKSCRVKKRKT